MYIRIKNITTKNVAKKVKIDSVKAVTEASRKLENVKNGKEILGYNITECPSRILLAEAIRKNIENILKCLSRSDKND